MNIRLVRFTSACVVGVLVVGCGKKDQTPLQSSRPSAPPIPASPMTPVAAPVATVSAPPPPSTPQAQQNDDVNAIPSAQKSANTLTDQQVQDLRMHPHILKRP